MVNEIVMRAVKCYVYLHITYTTKCAAQPQEKTWSQMFDTFALLKMCFAMVTEIAEDGTTA